MVLNCDCGMSFKFDQTLKQKFRYSDHLKIPMHERGESLIILVSVTQPKALCIMHL